MNLHNGVDMGEPMCNTKNPSRCSPEDKSTVIFPISGTHRLRDTTELGAENATEANSAPPESIALPHELIARILGYVQNLRCLARLRAVSRVFRDIVNWHPMYFGEITFEPISDDFRHIVRLILMLFVRLSCSVHPVDVLYLSVNCSPYKASRRTRGLRPDKALEPFFGQIGAYLDRIQTSELHPDKALDPVFSLITAHMHRIRTLDIHLRIDKSDSPPTLPDFLEDSKDGLSRLTLGVLAPQAYLNLNSDWMVSVSARDKLDPRRTRTVTVVTPIFGSKEACLSSEDHALDKAHKLTLGVLSFCLENIAILHVQGLVVLQVIYRISTHWPAIRYFHLSVREDDSQLAEIFLEDDYYCDAVLGPAFPALRALIIDGDDAFSLEGPGFECIARPIALTLFTGSGASTATAIYAGDSQAVNAADLYLYDNDGEAEVPDSYPVWRWEIEGTAGIEAPTLGTADSPLSSPQQQAPSSSFE